MRNYNLEAANAKLRLLRSRGWKPGMNTAPFDGADGRTGATQDGYHMTYAQIAEVLKYEGLTKRVIGPGHVKAILNRALRKLRESTRERD